MKQVTHLVSDLLKDIETDLGTEDMSKLFIKALHESVLQLECKDLKHFTNELKHFIHMINNSRPKYARLLDVCYKVWEEVKTHDTQENATVALGDILSKIESDRTNNMNHLYSYGSDIIEDGDTILIANRSTTVLEVLVEAHRIGKKFDVIIAELTDSRTQILARVLAQAGIPFSSVPAYELSHIIDRVNKVFMGAVTYICTGEYIMNTGSAGIVAMAQSHNIPSYMFMATSKFSLWKASAREIALRTAKKRCHQADETCIYEREFLS